ncbi:hypothetical protein DPX16_6302 [Anabarilius grahami]|uniref:Piezo TM1-24 domain-containing protein n=1 Tax=Anabarilius grahami TaxID=495550 RepID=A0A3N0YKE0_ANAGA|nr:hypothetical protein DPX16_6302 [Anabarilius grahami]
MRQCEPSSEHCTSLFLRRNGSFSSAAFRPVKLYGQQPGTDFSNKAVSYVRESEIEEQQMCFGGSEVLLGWYGKSCIFRYNALSLVYLLFLLLLPWFQWPNKHTLRGFRVGSSAVALAGASATGRQPVYLWASVQSSRAGHKHAGSVYLITGLNKVLKRG